MNLVGENKEFKIYFNSTNQTYSVYKDDKFFIGNKHRWIDVKTYID
jgi:hypothetical protein